MAWLVGWVYVGGTKQVGGCLGRSVDALTQAHTHVYMRAPTHTHTHVRSRARTHFQNTYYTCARAHAGHELPDSPHRLVPRGSPRHLRGRRARPLLQRAVRVSRRGTIHALAHARTHTQVQTCTFTRQVPLARFFDTVGNSAVQVACVVMRADNPNPDPDPDQDQDPIPQSQPPSSSQPQPSGSHEGHYNASGSSNCPGFDL